jgi:hypothetical protein
MCAADGTPQLLVCPDACSEDVAFEDCKCKVDTLVSGEMDWRNIMPCLIANETSRAAFEYFMPVDMVKDLTYMVATASVQEVFLPLS